MRTNEEPRTSADILADELYTIYCKSVGGVAFNGDKLPTWDEFRIDPNKEVQYNAWIAIAEFTLGVDMDCFL